MRFVRRFALVVGIAAFAWMVYKLGWRDLTQVLVDTGWWFLVIAAIDVAGGFTDAAAIVCFARPRHRVPFGRALAAQLGGVAINRMTPGNALGEPVKISLLVERIPQSAAVSTILMFDASATIVAVVTIAIGAIITLLVADLPSTLAIAMWIASGVLFVFTFAMILLVRRGPIRFGIYALRSLRIISRERALSWRERTKHIDDVVGELGKTPSSRVGIAFLTLSRMINWAGTIVMLYAAGLPITPAFIVAILTVGLLITWISHIVPLGLGIADGGNYLLYRAMGASGYAGIDFTMVYRVRTCILSAVGMTVLAITSYRDRRRRGTVLP